MRREGREAEKENTNEEMRKENSMGKNEDVLI